MSLEKVLFTVDYAIVVEIRGSDKKPGTQVWKTRCLNDSKRSPLQNKDRPRE